MKDRLLCLRQPADSDVVNEKHGNCINVKCVCVYVCGCMWLYSCAAVRGCAYVRVCHCAGMFVSLYLEGFSILSQTILSISV